MVVYPILIPVFVIVFLVGMMYSVLTFKEGVDKWKEGSDEW